MKTERVRGRQIIGLRLSLSVHGRCESRGTQQTSTTISLPHRKTQDLVILLPPDPSPRGPTKPRRRSRLPFTLSVRPHELVLVFACNTDAQAATTRRRCAASKNSDGCCRVLNIRRPPGSAALYRFWNACLSIHLRKSGELARAHFGKLRGRSRLASRDAIESGANIDSGCATSNLTGAHALCERRMWGSSRS